LNLFPWKQKKKPIFLGLVIAIVVMMAIFTYRDVEYSVALTLIIPSPAEASMQQSRLVYYQLMTSLFENHGFSTSFSILRYDSAQQLTSHIDRLRNARSTHVVVVYPPESYDWASAFSDKVYHANTLIIVPTLANHEPYRDRQEWIGLAPPPGRIFAALQFYFRQEDRVLWISNTPPAYSELQQPWDLRWFEWNPENRDLVNSIVLEFQPQWILIDIQPNEVIFLIESIEEAPNERIILSPKSTQFYMLSESIQELRGVIGMSWAHPQKIPSLSVRWDVYPTLDVVKVLSEYYARTRSISHFLRYLEESSFSGPFEEVLFVDGYKVQPVYFIELGMGITEPLFTSVPSRF
jgi:hypothetical protein